MLNFSFFNVVHWCKYFRRTNLFLPATGAEIHSHQLVTKCDDFRSTHVTYLRKQVITKEGVGSSCYSILQWSGWTSSSISSACFVPYLSTPFLSLWTDSSFTTSFQSFVCAKSIVITLVPLKLCLSWSKDTAASARIVCLKGKSPENLFSGQNVGRDRGAGNIVTKEMMTTVVTFQLPQSNKAFRYDGKQKLETMTRCIYTKLNAIHRTTCLQRSENPTSYFRFPFFSYLSWKHLDK